MEGRLSGLGFQSHPQTHQGLVFGLVPRLLFQKGILRMRLGHIVVVHIECHVFGLGSVYGICVALVCVSDKPLCAVAFYSCG